MVLSASSFGIVDGISKLLAEAQSVGQIVWARYALALPILLAAASPSKLPALIRTQRPALQILLGLTPLAVSVTMVLAVKNLPLAEATVILYAAPILVVALSVPILGERVHASSWVAVAIGFVAVLLVARPGFSELSNFTIFPMIAAVFYALMQLVTRKVAATGERPETTLAWTLLTGIVVSTPVALPLWEPLDLRGWLLMLALGASFGVAQLTMIRGFAHAPAALLTPLSYFQIVSAVIFSAVVFGEIPGLWTLLGIVMIVGSGLYVVRRRAE